MNLVDALAAFNRKERYWLLLNALGHGALTLDGGFRTKLGGAIGIDVPADAWWAMDYHLDWLVGALHLVGRGPDDRSVQCNEPSLISGNQEDIDLLIAFGMTLILVEAKGDTSWGNAQVQSKLKRLTAILRHQAATGGFVPDLRLVLMSPRTSEGLRPATGEVWPSWMLDRNGRPCWIELAMRLKGGRLVEGKAEFRRILRCIDDAGTVGQLGSHWKVT